MNGSIPVILGFLLIGYALSRFIDRVQPFLAGAGLTGSFLFVCGVLHVPMAAGLALLVVASVTTLVLKRQRPKTGAQMYPLLPSLIGVAVTLWLVVVAAVLPLSDYDGRAFWLLKAKAIAHERSVDGPFFQQQRSPSPRNSYPLLVPVTAALTMVAGGELDDRHARWLYVGFAVGFALLLRRELGELTSPAVGAWSAAVFLCLPQILTAAEGGALSGYADIAMGAFSCAAFLEALGPRPSALRFGFWVAFILLTKSEGLAIAATMLCLGIWVFRESIVVILAPVIPVTGALLCWRARLHRSDENDFGQMILHLPEHGARFITSLRCITAQLGRFDLWGPLWCLFLVAALSLLFRRRPGVLLLAAVVIVPMAILYAGVFAVTDWPLGVLADNLAPRVLTHLLGPVFAVIAFALSPSNGRSIATDVA